MSITDMDDNATPQDAAATAAASAAANSEKAPAAKRDETPSDEEDKDEEDDLFAAIEQQQHQNETSHQNDAQPHDATAAPKLLQAALQEGKVGADESEVESEEEHKKEKVEKKADEKKEEGEGGHVHQRVSKNRVRNGFEIMTWRLLSVGTDAKNHEKYGSAFDLI